MPSVFARQQERGHAAVGFSNNPEFYAGAERVDREQTQAVPEAEFILFAVVLVNIAPVSSDVANQVSEWVVSGYPERFQRTRSRNDRAGTELDPAHLATLMMPWFRL